MNLKNAQGALLRIAHFWLGGSYFRRFALYFCIALTVLLVGTWHQLTKWISDRGHALEFGPLSAVFATLIVSLSALGACGALAVEAAMRYFSSRNDFTLFDKGGTRG